jgi:hypothetical protein
MRAKFILEHLNENVSKFKKGMTVNTVDNSFYIKKVEPVNDKFDTLYVIDKYNKLILLSSKWLEQNGVIEPDLKSQISKEKSLTKKEYENMLKGAMRDLRYNSGLEVENEDEFDYYSLIDDMADSMIYDEELYNYLYKRYKRDYGYQPKRRDIKDMLVNDLSSY